MRANNKALIRKACVEVIENPNAKPREKLQAAGILEKLARAKALARLNKKKNAQTKNVNGQNPSVNDLLRQVSAVTEIAH